MSDSGREPNVVSITGDRDRQRREARDSALQNGLSKGVDLTDIEPFRGLMYQMWQSAEMDCIKLTETIYALIADDITRERAKQIVDGLNLATRWQGTIHDA